MSLKSPFLSRELLVAAEAIEPRDSQSALESPFLQGFADDFLSSDEPETHEVGEIEEVEIRETLSDEVEEYEDFATEGPAEHFGEFTDEVPLNEEREESEGFLANEEEAYCGEEAGEINYQPEMQVYSPQVGEAEQEELAELECDFDKPAADEEEGESGVVGGDHRLRIKNISDAEAYFEYDVPAQSSAPSDHPLREIADGQRGQLPDDILAAILTTGESDAKDLTNRVFWRKHPDLSGIALDPKDARPKQRALRKEWGTIFWRHVKPIIWLRWLIEQLDQHRGSIPREFLLGWIAAESDGKVSTVSTLGEQGYFQIMWQGGEAQAQLGLTRNEFLRLSTDREFSIEKGIQLAETYRQHFLRKYPNIPDNSELLWLLTKSRHALPSALDKVLNRLVKAGSPITWQAVSQNLPKMASRVGLTLGYAAKLKPLADRVSAPAATTPQPEFEQQVPRRRSPPPVCSSPSATTGQWLNPFTVSDQTIPKYKDANGTLQATDCSIYVPAVAMREKQIDLLVFFHGDYSPCKDCFDPDPKTTSKKFGLDAQIQNSKRKIALAVPRIYWNGNNVSQVGGKWTAANFNKFVEEVLDQIGNQTSVEPTLGNLIIAGHSRAYNILTPLAREFNQGAPATTTGHWAKLAEVWALDSTYGPKHVRALDAWASARHSVRFIAVLYKKGSPLIYWNSYYKGYSFGFGPPPNLRMCAVDEGGNKTHCVIPTKYVSNQLSTTRNSPDWCQP